MIDLSDLVPLDDPKEEAARRYVVTKQRAIMAHRAALTAGRDALGAVCYAVLPTINWDNQDEAQIGALLANAHATLHALLADLDERDADVQRLIAADAGKAQA